MRVTVKNSHSRIIMIAFVCFNWCVELAFAEPKTVSIAYLSQELEAPPALSNLDSVIQDGGIQGALLAIKDNNTTGQFTDQKFLLEEFRIPLQGDVDDVFRKIVAKGYRLVIANLTTENLRKLQALPKFDGILVFDAVTRDDEFRNATCQPNLLHMQPSRAMRTDALAQYFVKKRWTTWLIVTGPEPADLLYAQAIRRSAKKFGIKIIEEKRWDHTYDARRTAQSDVPVFTQNTVDYDILMVADEKGMFGEYLAYRSWTPQLIAGTQGLVATSWHRTHEQWGAVQLQNRFREQASRWMAEEDYGAWLAVRAIGESATRSQSVEFTKIKKFLLGKEFTLAGFKGKKLTFRSWNGQLRQPVLLAAARSLVAAPPLDGFLHPTNELDTLGYDQPESSCGSTENLTGVKPELRSGQANVESKQGFSLWWEKLKKKLQRAN